MIHCRRAASILLTLAITVAASAQLNEHCTISVLNRTAQVDSSGFWQIDNIPANAGTSRARAVCTENGITSIGVSGWFTIPANGVIFANDVQFELPPPVPARMTLTASKQSLGNIGDTLQLSPVVTFPDGSSRGVPDASDGTNYTTSSSRVLTVSPSGLVTAVGTGTAIVSASNEGSLGLLRISVATGPADSDGDGMPDDWELTNDLNPNDPADAARDEDGDGLTNLQEFGQQTDPWNADTDGDGIRDGLEVQVGSNPLDANSYDLGRSLRSLAVTPDPLPLVINAVYGEALRLLTVRGELLDGSFIDLRSKTRGTTYGTGNPAVASFTSFDGEVRAGSNGSSLITVSNSGFTATTTVTVSQFSSEAYAPLALPGYGNDIACAGSYCYIAAGSAGLQIVNVANPGAPAIVGTYPTSSLSQGVAILGTTAFIADGGAGLLIVDVSVPSSPALLAQHDTPGTAAAVVVRNGIAYVADTASGVHLVDVSDPRNPVRLSTFADGTQPMRLVGVDGPYMVVMANGNMWIVDVSDPAAPRQVYAASVGIVARTLYVRGRTAFIGFTGGSSVRVVDFTIPEFSRIVANPTETTTRRPIDFAPRGGLLLSPDSINNGGILGLELSDIITPFIRTTLPTTGFSSALAANSTHLFHIAGNQFSLPASSGTSFLEVKKYVSAPEGDFKAPQVSLLSTPPADVLEGSTFTLQVAAADESGVAKVDVYANGVVLSSRSLRPFNHSIRVPSGDALDIRIVAEDFAGNSAQVPNFTIPVRRDTTPPVVSISASATAFGGANQTVTAQATDVSGVARVDFYVNGQFQTSDNFLPYSFTFKPANVDSDLTLEARAFDIFGNMATAQRQMHINQDRPPVVNLLQPLTTTVLYDRAELIVKSTASDDRGITQVELRINGVQDESSNFRSSGKYDFWYDIPVGMTSVTIEIVAWDNIQQSTTATLTLPVNPTAIVGTVDLPGGVAWDLDVYDNRGYVASGPAGLKIVDLTNPASPAVLGVADTPGDARQVRVFGRYAFVADREGGLAVIDVLTPAAPAIAVTAVTTGSAYSMLLRGDRLYVGTAAGLDIFDISNPLLPRRTNFIRTNPTITSTPVLGLALHGNDLIVLRQWENSDLGCQQCGVITRYSLANVDQPAKTGQIGPYTTNPNLAIARVEAVPYASLAVQGNTAYTGGYSAFHTWNLSPQNPVDINAYDPGNRGYFEVVPHGKTGFMAWSDSKDATALLDLTDPANVIMSGVMYLGALGRFYGTGVAGTDELVYSVGTSIEPSTITASSTVANRLYVNRYATLSDPASIAPVVAITASQATAFENEAVTFVATASDDVGVKSVTFAVDGMTAATDTIAPYELVSVMTAGLHTITATAIDYGGNSAEAQVTVTANSDTTAPTVSLQAPNDGDVVPGQGVHIVAQASDDFSVARVEFVANGVVIGTDTVAPYDIDYAIPAGMTSSNVFARAFDVAGNMAESEQRTVTVILPQLRSSFPVTANDVDVEGRYAYVAGGLNGLHIIDINNPAAPVLVSTLSMGASIQALKVRVVGHQAFLAVTNGIVAVDVSQPAAPALISGAFLPNGQQVTIDRTKAYVAATSPQRLIVYDISRLAVPVSVRTDTLSLSFVARAIETMGRDAAGLMIGDNLEVYTTLSASSVKRDTLTSALGVNTGNVRQKDGFIVAGTNAGLFTSDFATRMAVKKTVPSATPLTFVALHDRYAAAATDQRPARVHLFDASERTNPVLRGVIDFTPYGTQKITGMAMTPTLVVASAETRLYIASYRSFTDTRGQAPAAVLDVPATGNRGRLLPIEVRATDDVGVKEVVFRIDGVDVFTDTVAPYFFNYTIGPAATVVNVEVRAVDHAGNVSQGASAQVVANP